MKFVAVVVAAVAVLEALVLAFIPLGQSGALGEHAGNESFLQPLTTVNYWLTTALCVAAVVVLLYCASSVSVYPRSPRRTVLRTSSLVGFALIQLGYVVFAVCVGLVDGNPAMFCFSLLGMAAFLLAVALLRVRPRNLVAA